MTKSQRWKLKKESVNILIDQLKGGDRFGILLFESKAKVAKRIELVSEMDINNTKENILEIKANGGTNLEEGCTEATKLFEDYKNSNKSEYLY